MARPLVGWVIPLLRPALYLLALTSVLLPLPSGVGISADIICGGGGPPPPPPPSQPLIPLFPCILLYLYPREGVTLHCVQKCCTLQVSENTYPGWWGGEFFA